MGFKKLGLTALVLLALKGGYAQSDSPLTVSQNISDFYRTFNPSVSNWLIDASGKISWDSKHYIQNNDYIRELRGYCNLDVSFLLIGVEKIHVGFITKINTTQNTLETIIYNNGSKKKDISSYDSLIAKKDSINLSITNEIYHEIVDYNSRSVKNMETQETDTLLNNSVGFQEAYFKVPKDRDSFVNVRFKGEEYVFQTKSKIDEDGKYIFIDLTMPDPINHGKRKNIVDKISNIKVYYDNRYIPIKVVARVNTPIGETNVTAEYTPNAHSKK